MRKFLTIAGKSVLAVVSLAGVGLLFLAGYLVWHYQYGFGLPTADRLAALAATGPACSGDPPGTYIPLAEIPPLLQKAATLYDEPDFYERWSTNPFIEIAISVAQNRRPRSSSITTFIARCLMPPPEGPGLDRQIATLVLQSRISQALSRDRILEIYLNETYLGRSSQGVAAASMAYFGKPLGLLTIDEIAFVASLARAPFLVNVRQSLAKERRDFIIDRMLQASLVSEAEAAAARERPLAFRDSPSKQQKL
jgi:penicillin-binding protein 1A